MALSPAMNQKLNEQIVHEMFASQTYLAMACLFDRLALKRLSELFMRQSEEEREHALKILRYILEAEGTVTLGSIPQPPKDWPSVLAAIEAALEHERRVTGQINALVALADEERDYATRSFLNWYVDEQVEEVATMLHLAEIAKLAGPALLHLEAYVAHTKMVKD